MFRVFRQFSDCLTGESIRNRVEESQKTKMKKPKIIQIAYMERSANPTYLLDDGRVFGWVTVGKKENGAGEITYDLGLVDITPKLPPNG